MRHLKHFLLGSIFFALSSAVLAQTANVTGIILSEDEKPVSGAHIYLTPSKWAVSNEDGTFQMTGVPTGVYTLMVTNIAFKDYSRELTLKYGVDLHLEIVLERAIFEDQQVVVTASRTKKDLEDVSVPITVIDDKEIEMSGSLRLSDVLDEQVGLNIVSDHGTGVQVQGFDPEYTLILIDNQPVIGRTAGTFDLTRLAVGDIKQIEMVKGPSSALWGSNALAGVINIITEKGSEPLRWDISGRYGSNTSYDGATNLSFKTDKLSGRFFSNINGSTGYDLTPNTLAPTIPEFRNYTLSSGLDYRLHKNITLRLSGRYYREDQRYDDEIETQPDTFRPLEGTEFQEDFSLTPEISVTLGTRQLLEATAYLSTFNSESRLDYTDDDTNYFYDSFEQSLNKFEAKSSTFWSPAHTTVVGAGMNREDLTADIYADIPFFDSYFGYGQHEWQLSQKLSLTGGFRFDTHSEYDSQLSPKFSGLYKPSDLIHFRASLGGGYKAPDFRQLFLNFTNPVAGYTVFGSSTVVEGIQRLQNDGQIQELYYDPNDIRDIKAEHSFAYNAGLDLFPAEGLQFRVNFFRNDVQDLIETQRIALKTNGQSVFGYINLNRIYTRGTEAELRYKPAFTDGLSLALGYQLLDAKRELTREFDTVENGQVVTKTSTEYVQMFNRSRHTGNFKIFYALDDLGALENLNLETSLRIQYRGRYGFADYNSNQEVDTNEYADGYTIVNASLARIFYDRVRFQVGVNNILNYQNAQYLPSNPGKTFYAQINIKLH